MKRLSFFLLTMLAAATAGAQQTYTYTLRGSSELKLDVYQPVTRPLQRPAAVFPFSGVIHCRNSRLEYAAPPASTCFVHGKMDLIVTYKRLCSSFSTSLFGRSRLAKLFKRNGYCYWMVRVEGRGHEVSEAHTCLMDELCAFVDAAWPAISFSTT